MDIGPTTRAVKRSIEGLGYRVGVAYIAHDAEHGLWVCTAKDDKTGQFHVAKADKEATAIAELAASVGIDLEE